MKSFVLKKNSINDALEMNSEEIESISDIKSILSSENEVIIGFSGYFSRLFELLVNPSLSFIHALIDMNIDGVLINIFLYNTEYDQQIIKFFTFFIKHGKDFVEKASIKEIFNAMQVRIDNEYDIDSTLEFFYQLLTIKSIGELEDLDFIIDYIDYKWSKTIRSEEISSKILFNIVQYQSYDCVLERLIDISETLRNGANRIDTVIHIIKMCILIIDKNPNHLNLLSNSQIEGGIVETLEDIGVYIDNDFIYVFLLYMYKTMIIAPVKIAITRAKSIPLEKYVTIILQANYDVSSLSLKILTFLIDNSDMESLITISRPKIWREILLNFESVTYISKKSILFLMRSVIGSSKQISLCYDIMNEEVLQNSLEMMLDDDSEAIIIVLELICNIVTVFETNNRYFFEEFDYLSIKEKLFNLSRSHDEKIRMLSSQLLSKYDSSTSYIY